MAGTTAGTDGPEKGMHAVVVGASMAGLLAARVLAAHVERVTVVERDTLPDGAEHRKGVPQGRQLHVLLPRGREIVDRLFPGYSRELHASGAVPLQVPRDLLTLTRSGWLDRRAPGWAMLSASRPLFEATARRRLRQLPGVTLLERSEATGLHGSGDGRTVTGVAVRRLDSGEVARLDADLVVDASGRGSRMPAWLAALGLPRPDRTQVDPDIAYACRILRIPAGFTADWKAVMLTSRPPSVPRSGYLFPIEGGRWIVAVMGIAGQHPPADAEGWSAFLRTLRHPVVADAVAHAEPLTPVHSHRGTENRQWHVERMRRRPERFVVLGDAVCAFNPVYGQGMSAAAVAAETLDACLLEHRRRHPDRDLDGLAPRFQRRLARRNADPWNLSTGEDLRFPTTSGTPASRTTRLMHRYLDRVDAASTRDPRVADTYVRVTGMLDRPSAVFRPHVLAAVLRARPGGASPAEEPAARAAPSAS